MATLKSCWRRAGSLAICLLATRIIAVGAPATPKDPLIKDLNTPRDFPAISTRPQWQQRARAIREHALVSCGLWPLPQKTPLKPQIFGKIDREGYSVEKVYIQTMPGFYLAGNLYRPLGRGAGPFPGVLNPHGHWKEGRLVDTKDGSVAARCISFARQGMVAFSYDMVGYNDTRFSNASTNKASYESHRSFGAARADQLWSISLMGLQTWNSIRALDFLESLPDVDKKRLGCTGESGGGTQTFILGAVDDRLAIQAPIVMVSHSMQGGCSCENAPGLRIEYSNMEFAAAPAPRPQKLVAATGDWTKDTLAVEGPSIARIYELLNARDKFDFVCFDFGHNYNQTSREAVYTWFGKWLLPTADPALLKEASCQKEPDVDLRVFPDGKLPADAMTREQFTESLKSLYQQRWESLIPKDRDALEEYKQTLMPAWRHTFGLPSPQRPPQIETDKMRTNGQFTVVNFKIKPRDSASPILANYWAPLRFLSSPIPKIVVLAQPNNSTSITDEEASPAGLTLALLQRGNGVIEFNWSTGVETADQFTNFFTTYNLTRVQQRVRDLVNICATAQAVEPRQHRPFRVVLLGTGVAGFWSLCAAPAADAVVADANNLDVSDDQVLLDPNFFTPGLRNLGVCEGIALLAAPHPLLVHRTAKRFSTTTARAAYKSLGKFNQVRIEPGVVTDDGVAKWIAEL
jgi:hypothetical protein